MHISLSPDTRTTLESWQLSTEVPASYAFRARAVLLVSGGRNVSETANKLGVSRQCIYKWLHKFSTGNPHWYKNRSRRPHRSPNRISVCTEQKIISIAVALASAGRNPTARMVRASLSGRGGRPPALSTIQIVINKARTEGRVQPPRYAVGISTEEEKVLRRLTRRKPTSILEARRARAILLLVRGKPIRSVALALNTSATVIRRWKSRFERYGLSAIYHQKRCPYKKDQDENIKQQVFRLLHSPPKDNGVNRTSWRIPDLKNCLEKMGILLSEAVISRIVKAAGFKWKKARKVLTSPDPDYKEKLENIKKILRALRSDERFFSIDEFGPLAIRKREGRCLVGPGEENWVPQWQRAKGSLIMTAALELSTNQVTHFYSERKNSNEIIKLIEVLLAEYSEMKTLYLSWDAASWHNSTALWKWINKANRLSDGTGSPPYVKVVPLPMSAQFLNVIESVFSGLAKAVIHNSDYESVETAKAAIDQYFCVRNTHYRNHPKRAGKKIWGEERVVVQFSESHNCKDPRW